jgi:hypothetical protein
MVGYPYHTEVNNSEKVFVSDHVVDNSKYFVLGFMLAIATTPGLAFADEIKSLPGTSPTFAPTGGNAPTQVRDSVQAIIAIAGCGAAATQCSNVGNQAVKAATDKLNTLNPPSMAAVGGCLLLAGYCAGKLSTKGIDKLFGFA